MRLLAFLVGIIITFSSFGINHADSVNVYFRVGQSRFDPSLGENGREMDSFIGQVREAVASGTIDRITVRGYASPDGKSNANERLARNRCASIADYIVRNAGVSRELIEEIPEGVGWSELRRLVAENPDVPSREDVLRIIDNTPIWVYNSSGEIIDGRKKQLMSLRGGRPYRWMLANFFPLLRNSVGVILSVNSEPEERVEPECKSDNIQEPVENSVSIEKPDTTESPELAISTSHEKTEPINEYDYRRHHFALKTNLLYDAILMPNLEFEWFINKHWSVSLEGDVAWWKPKEYKVYRLAIISPEVRYHIRPKAPWHGMYVGLFAGGGLYQLENGGQGYKGEGGMGGLSFGYMWPIGKHFFMDAEIGAGYMRTDYKVYEPREGHRIYLRTKSLNYFGPLKLKLSIAWQFDINSKTKKVSSIQ